MNTQVKPRPITKGPSVGKAMQPEHLAEYHATCVACSKLITQRYSTSFTLGIRTLRKSLQDPIYSIYGFVRYADEIVDSFDGFEKEALLKRFEEDTWQAIADGISLNPVLDAFQLAVNEFNIPRHLIEAFLHSMAMDLEQKEQDVVSYNTYIYGSAEVVGLMCLMVFCRGDEAEYDELQGNAKRLGAAFQKVNFLRDIKSDFADRGRVYFPGANMERWSEADKKAVEKDIQADFDAGLLGIKRLPADARFGVYLAYRYYLRLLAKIEATTAAEILKVRIRVADSEKFTLLCKGYLRSKFNMI
jgi:phytoene/squalene synthetase